MSDSSRLPVAEPVLGTRSRSGAEGGLEEAEAHHPDESNSPEPPPPLPQNRTISADGITRWNYITIIITCGDNYIRAGLVVRSRTRFVVIL
jgi:hypothetical protein